MMNTIDLAMKKKKQNNNANREHALVVFSGGQDSATCLLLALTVHAKVTAVNFQYGQRHVKEVAAARSIAKKLKVSLVEVALGFIPGLVSSALTDTGDIAAPHKSNKALPASFVPGRNALFLTTAHALAQEIGAGAIYTGVCETDYSGYPDCRQTFVTLLQTALNEGYETNISFEAPLMNLSKAEIFKLAAELDGLELVVNDTLTCYQNNTTHYPWGAGCGTCPACVLRKRGYAEFCESAFKNVGMKGTSLVNAINQVLDKEKK